MQKKSSQRGKEVIGAGELKANKERKREAEGKEVFKQYSGEKK